MYMLELSMMITELYIHLTYAIYYVSKGCNDESMHITLNMYSIVQILLKKLIFHDPQPKYDLIL